MNQRIKDQYNSLYTAQKDVYGEGKPMPFVQRLNKYLSGGSILDLGGGEGRNALYLAQEGFFVTVYDISEVGIARLTERAKEHDLSVVARVADIVNEPIEGIFDAIINTFVLHHMDTVDAQRVIAESQEHTAENGVHILSTFTNKGDLADRSKKSGRFYPSEEVVRELYADWDIKELAIRETTTHARHKNGERMKNNVVFLIATKK